MCDRPLLYDLEGPPLVWVERTTWLRLLCLRWHYLQGMSHPHGLAAGAWRLMSLQKVRGLCQLPFYIFLDHNSGFGRSHRSMYVVMHMTVKTHREPV